MIQYRIKEVEEAGHRSFYPQYKKRWLWRRFTWLGGEDGTSPRTVYYRDKSSAKAHIENHKKKLTLKAEARKVIYHSVTP